jgi:hypothetical protein
MHQQRRVVSPGRQPRPLRLSIGIQQANGDRVDLRRRGRRDDLDRRDRITCEKQVPSGRLQLDSPAHGHLCGLLAPPQRSRDPQRDDEIRQLDAFNLGR